MVDRTDSYYPHNDQNQWQAEQYEYEFLEPPSGNATIGLAGFSGGSHSPGSAFQSAGANEWEGTWCDVHSSPSLPPTQNGDSSFVSVHDILNNVGCWPNSANISESLFTSSTPTSSAAELDLSYPTVETTSQEEVFSGHDGPFDYHRLPSETFGNPGSDSTSLLHSMSSPSFVVLTDQSGVVSPEGHSDLAGTSVSEPESGGGRFSATAQSSPNPCEKFAQATANPPTTAYQSAGDVVQQNVGSHIVGDCISPSNLLGGIFSQPSYVCFPPLSPRPLGLSSGTARKPESTRPATPGPRSPFAEPPGKRKHKTITEAGRKKIKTVRDIGACFRCKIYKETCDENYPCGRCVQVLNTALFPKPCLRERPENIIAFRAGNSRAGKFRSEFMVPRWTAEDTAFRTLRLFYPFSHAHTRANKQPLVIKCRKFIPTEKDNLKDPYTMSTGEVVMLESSPFACYDQKHCVGAMKEYLLDNKTALLEESLDLVSNELLSYTIAETNRYCLKYEDSTVSIAMNIRAAAYFSRMKMVLAPGSNPLDLPYFDEHNGACPVPSIIDYQIDYLAIHYMADQMKLLIKRLKKLLFNRKGHKKNWYEIYLTIFVLLHSLETVHAAQIRYLSQFEAKGGRIPSQTQEVGNRMIDEWRHSAKVLIYYFRFVLRGMVPFKSEWDDKHEAQLREEGGLDEQAIEYARRLAALLKEQDKLKEASTEDIDNVSAKPLVWISRLYVDR